MADEQVLFVRIKYQNSKKWIKIAGKEINNNIINTTVSNHFGLENQRIEYYDEANYRIEEDLLIDFLWFSQRGVTLVIKLENEDFDELPSTPRSVGSTATVSSGIDDVPGSVIFATTLTPRPDETIQYSFNEQEFLRALEASPEGKNILEEYKNTGEVSIANRKKLTNTTVAIMMNQYGHHPRKNIKYEHAKALVKIFKNFEDKDGKGYELFFNPENRTGFLENRLRSVNRGLSEKKETQVSQKDANPSCVQDYSADLEFLRNACAKTQRQEILSRMVNTFNIRRKSDNILTEYPRFLDTPGLITQDFYLIHKNTGCLVSNFTNLIPKINYVCKKDISNDLPKEWDVDTNAILDLLSLLPPTARGRGGVKKVSMTDAVPKLICFHHISLPLDAAIQAANTAQPYLVAVGTNKQTIIDYYIKIDSFLILCEAKTALGAFDELFQCHFVFKIRFDNYLKSFWHYIQQEVYHLKTNEFVTLTPREKEVQIKIGNAPG